MAWERITKLNSQFQMIELWQDTEVGAFALLLNKELQFFVPGEHVYHESLAGIPMLYAPPKAKVCVLGGGDGLAAREILKFDPEQITICDVDPEVTTLCSENESIRAVNKDSLNNERCGVINYDGPAYIKEKKGWDVVICDYPDPQSMALDRLFSTEHYADIHDSLSEKGVMAVQASAANLPIIVAQVAANVREAGFKAIPYWASTFWGRYGFVLGLKGNPKGNVSVLRDKEFFYLTPKLARAMFVWGKGEEEIFKNAKSGSAFQALVLSIGLCKRFYPFKEE